jgi:hypothetical protein
MTRRRLLLGLIAALAAPASAKRMNPTAKIVARDVQGDTLVIRIDVGSNQGIEKHWTLKLVKRDGAVDHAIEVRIIRILPKFTTARVRLTIDQIARYDRVTFYPP